VTKLNDMREYGTYCPVAKAAEVLTERWTLLLVRDMLLGARRFNDFRRSIPLITPAVLSKRLKSLQDAGIIAPASTERGRREYRLTPAGKELKPFVDFAGEWGQRWARSALPPAELHPSTLMWDIHRFIKTSQLPARRVVIYVEFTDLKKMKRWWLVSDHGVVDVCLDDPGHELDMTISCTLPALAQVFMGYFPLEKAQASGRLKIQGDARLVRSMPRWFGLMPFSAVKPGGVSSVS